MKDAWRRRSLLSPQRTDIIIMLMLTVAMVAVTLLSGGCGGRGREGKIEDLFVSNERHVVDEEGGTVRVYGEVQNGGQGRVRQAAVYVILRSAGGETRGENNLILENIQPQEKRLFSLDVHSHGRVADVDVEVRKPEAP